MLMIIGAIVGISLSILSTLKEKESSEKPDCKTLEKELAKYPDIVFQLLADRKERNVRKIEDIAREKQKELNNLLNNTPFHGILFQVPKIVEKETLITNLEFIRRADKIKGEMKRIFGDSSEKMQ